MIRNFGNNLSNVQNVGQGQNLFAQFEKYPRQFGGIKQFNKPPQVNCCPEYVEDIYHYLLSTDTRPTHKKLLVDRGLTDFKRFKVFQAVKKAQIELELKTTTFYVAFDIFEKYMVNETRMQSKDLYTLILSCVFIASKYEEIYPPSLFQYSCDHAIQNTIILYESHILMKLDFKVQNNNLFYWVNLYFSVLRPDSQPSPRVLKFAQFLTDVMLIYNDFIPFKRSELAKVILVFLEDLLGYKDVGLNWNMTTKPTKDHEAYVMLCYRIKEDTDKQSDRNVFEDTKDFRSNRDTMDSGIKWLKEYHRI